MIRLLDARTQGLDGVVEALARSPERVDPGIQAAVDVIVASVRERGDDALCELTARFDGFEASDAAALAIPAGELADAERALPADVAAALGYASDRIARYHRAALPTSWRMTDEHGSVLGQEVRPLDRVGIYVPGGRAAYPSTVLMTAIPARVAGVSEIVLVTPPDRSGRVDPTVLGAARVGGVTEAWRIGGAQAIAALAFGTKTIRRVDKIVGPGNVYVALAKRRVFGAVGIDMIAGPSEVLVVADRSADPDWVAADMLAQAEHDPMARAVLVTDSEPLAHAAAAALDRRLPMLSRRQIAADALAANGAIVIVADLAEAAALANALAPEHLELVVGEPGALLERVRHAGAVFIGRHTPEVVGDYVAGPNHVLPTGGTARFSSPLGPEDFVTRSSVIAYSERGLADAWPHLAALARVEGLGAHAAAAEARIGEFVKESIGNRSIPSTNCGDGGRRREP